MGEQEARSEAVRLTTLEILSLIAVANGLLIAFTGPHGSPSLALLDRLIIWPEILGSMLLVSGAAQWLSVRFSQPRLVVLSCTMSALWYAFFSGSFLLTWLVWRQGWLGIHGGPEPSLYPTVVYLGLSCLHLTQGYTAWVKYKMEKIKSQRRRGVAR